MIDQIKRLCIALFLLSLPCTIVYYRAAQTAVKNSMEVMHRTPPNATAPSTTNSYSANTKKRVRFTQMWSTGHVGTQFLAGLMAAPDFIDKNCTGDYIAWNEWELPLTKPTESIYDLSLYDYKAMIASKHLTKNNDKGQKNFRRFMSSEPDRWYGGDKIKQWNHEGNTAALRAYQEKERMPALRSVYERYNNQAKNPNEKLTHFIKNGHTAMFFNLSDYYDVLSSTSLDGETTIDVDFVRIRRRRIEIANSFVSEPRLDLVDYGTKRAGIVSNPKMKTALFRFESLGGPLPDEVYWNWTLFQRHLWFCDEIEARWRVFLKEHPDVRYYELSYSASEENPDKQKLTPSSIDDLALNFLDVGHPLSPYIKHISSFSHKTNSKKAIHLSQEEKEEQAIEYSKQAPWCLQYEGERHISSGYPRLDCGILA